MTLAMILVAYFVGIGIGTFLGVVLTRQRRSSLTEWEPPPGALHVVREGVEFWAWDGTMVARHKPEDRAS